ncbi:uncharacterized protein FPRO_08898 [Fusarium proliferatum ET1]|uniref:Uncharacterized protein n=1 Tax=Fusarium proliferatum (strain ET1) TaxID=1227346 RepID=A0A1L7W9T4_FUSPR|nr:uncharacterized protein FPRO_08898 [Fusarium proliferatum ET1]CZR49361.1 uncharacterized protein FPRO_08898 [Fusarium proliferatum ET1]
MERETQTVEDERRRRLDSGSYRRSHTQPWSSDRDEQDDYDETGHSGRISNRTYHPTRLPSPVQGLSYFPHEDFRLLDILDISRTGRREKTNLCHDFDPRDLGRSNHSYKPNRAPSLYRGYTSYNSSYSDFIEIAQGTGDTIMIEKDKKRSKRERMRDRRPRAEELAARTQEAIRQAELEIKTAASNKAEEEAERLWRADYPEDPQSRLCAIRSFSKLSSKDTIYKDNTIGDEGRIDDLLASVGKNMIKNSFLERAWR